MALSLTFGLVCALSNSRMSIIDAHVHLLPPERLASLLRWVHRLIDGHPYAEDMSIDSLIDEYDRLGIEYVFNMVYPIHEGTTGELNRFNYDLARRYQPRILAVGSMHITDEHKLAIVDTCIQDYGFLGLKFHPFIQRFDPWDERLFPVYERMSELRRPIFIHTGYESFYNLTMPIDTLEREILARFPELPLVFMHALFPCLEEAFRLLEHYPHLYLDIANVYSTIIHEPYRKMYGRPAMEFHGFFDHEIVRQTFYHGLNRWHHRILFGSDHPSSFGALEAMIEEIRYMPISEEAKTNILCGTATAFLEKYHSGWRR